MTEPAAGAVAATLPRDRSHRARRFGPVFATCLRKVAWNLGLPLAALWVLLAAMAIFASDDSLGLGALALAAGVFAAAIFVGAFLVWVLFRPWSVTVDANAISGRDAFGRRRTLAWADIGEVRSLATKGPWNLMAAHRARRGFHIAFALPGVDSAQLHAHLARTAGPDHPLTLAFAGDANP